MPIPLRTGADLSGQKIVNLAAGTAPSDGVTFSQLNAAIRGMDVKDSVRVAALTNLNLASPGGTINGVTMAAGNRFLAAGQTTASQNGIYVWNGATTAATRAVDYDENYEVTASTLVPVEEGSDGDKVYILTTNNPITLGTTDLTFTVLPGAAVAYTAGNTTITISGTQISVKLKASGGVIFDADGLYVDPNVLSGRLEGDVPAGSASVAITHNLGIQYLGESRIYDKSTGQRVLVDEFATSTTQFTFVFAVAPTAGQYRYVLAK